jgi:hypothetical protein
MENINLPTYKYEPLPQQSGAQSSNWIRVFDLLPSVRLGALELAKSSPKRSEQYDTISYVWGEESTDDKNVLIIH